MFILWDIVSIRPLKWSFIIRRCNGLLWFDISNSLLRILCRLLPFGFGINWSTFLLFLRLQLATSHKVISVALIIRNDFLLFELLDKFKVQGIHSNYTRRIVIQQGLIKHSCIMIETSIIIEAPIAVVRNVFFDFVRYPQWNPFLIKLQGETSQKGQIHVDILLPGDSSPNHFDPLVLVKNQNQFRWLGMLWCSCCFAGEHYFLFKEISPSRTELIHGENFTGCMASLLLCMIETKTRNGFESMNKALKQRCENSEQGSAHILMPK